MQVAGINVLTLGIGPAILAAIAKMPAFGSGWAVYVAGWIISMLIIKLGSVYGKDRAKQNTINENKTKTKNTMKRLRFKKPFDGLGNALGLIPENYKVDNKEFEMTDGNESYTIRWEGDLNEGSAVVLKAADQNMINEDMEKMKHLMGFKSEETLGRVKGEARINENEAFKDVWNKTRNVLNENATGVAGMGLVAEEEVNEEVNEDEVNEEAKPDYIDIDNDGDKEESMKDAAKDAE
jgi:hypothetical protein